MKPTFSFQFQIGLMFTITAWYKGTRCVVLSLPFVDIEFTQIHKKYKYLKNET